MSDTGTPRRVFLHLGELFGARSPHREASASAREEVGTEGRGIHRAPVRREGAARLGRVQAGLREKEAREPHAERNAARARASDSTTMRTRASGSTKGTGDDRL